MRTIIFLALFICTNALAQNQVKARKLLVIGVDGLKANFLHKLVTTTELLPSFSELMKSGTAAHCPKASSKQCARAHVGPLRSKDVFWKTASGWASVLSGVNPGKHQVRSNGYNNIAQLLESSRKYPSFLKIAKANDRHTAASGVASFLSSTDGSRFSAGVLDFECASDPKPKELIELAFLGSDGMGEFFADLTDFLEVRAVQEDDVVAFDADSSCNLSQRYPLSTKLQQHDEVLQGWLLRQLNKPQADVMMVVYDTVDLAGHQNGFSDNPYYRTSLQAVDKKIGQVVNKLKTRVKARKEEWLVIITSDHGGHTYIDMRGKTRGAHNRKPNEDDAVPFIISLIGSSQELQDLKSPISHLDVHPTALQWLGLPIGSDLDGQIQALKKGT